MYIYIYIYIHILTHVCTYSIHSGLTSVLGPIWDFKAQGIYDIGYGASGFLRQTAAEAAALLPEPERHYVYMLVWSEREFPKLLTFSRWHVASVLSPNLGGDSVRKSLRAEIDKRNAGRSAVALPSVASLPGRTCLFLKRPHVDIGG